MELAVFGAILIFVVGAIVRQAMSASYMQNQYLRAMRQAMSTSFRYSQGLMGVGGSDGTMSHNTATILLVEDRLTADSAKYGAIDRTPYMINASATHSRNLMMPMNLDAGAESDVDLPIFDVFVNGKHFPFTTARFRRVCLKECMTDDDPCPSDKLCANSWKQKNYPCTPVDCNPVCPNYAAACSPVAPILASDPPWDPVNNRDLAAWELSWDPNCATQTGLCRNLCVPPCDGDYALGGDCFPGTYDINGNEIDPPSAVPFTRPIGCTRLYTRTYNHPQIPEWCDDVVLPCPNACPAACNLTADERFDLDRDGASYDPPNFDPGSTDPDVPGAFGTAREKFSWQWYLVMGFDESRKQGANGITTTLDRAEGINLSKGKNASVDVDEDLKTENIIQDTLASYSQTGVITQFQVIDYQEGDFDSTVNENEGRPMPGFTRDTTMSTRVRDGTYLLIEEGNLYDDGLQYIRTTQKKDHIDLIERVMQLSNDTNRFCDSSGNLTTAGWTAPIPNPVEVCSDECRSAANINLTCMDEDPAGDGSQPPVIFVRSRVVDRHGRKWITETTSDPYVEFVAPGGP